ncbi:hypothetical protein I552_8905 [Mycobacterium xenopi 3993]|nr:hypothetical protein I552_8905 [Mycobacterium xenopi 3993]
MAERLIDAVAVSSAAGAECQVGVADQLSTAVFAARAAGLWGREKTRDFCRRCRSVNWPPSPACPARPRRTGRPVVADGNSHHRAVRCAAAHRRGIPIRRRRGGRAPIRPRRAGAPPCGREPPPDLDAVLPCDPPIDRVDAAAFAGARWPPRCIKR